MKNSIVKTALPLTIITFILYTKWWLVERKVGGMEIIYGFPFPFMANGATSLTFTFFIQEFVLDFTVYFLFWWSVLFFINRFVKKILWHRRFWIPLWLFTLFLMMFTSLLWSDGANLYRLKNNQEYKVLKSGFHYVGDDKTRKEWLKEK